MLTDLNIIPFSRAGSLLTIARDAFTPGRRLVVRSARSYLWGKTRRGEFMADFFEIGTAVDGAEVPYDAVATPWSLELRTQAGRARIAFDDTHTLVMDTEGVDLCLHLCKRLGWHAFRSPGHVLIHDPDSRFSLHTVLADTQLDAGPGEDGRFRVRLSGQRRRATLALRTTSYERPFDRPLPLFEAASEGVRTEYNGWCARRPPVPAEFESAAQFAWFMLWNLQVARQGCLTRRAILMSKMWMNAVWAWDNCFDALAVVEADPELAWDQLRLITDHQVETGMLPDAVHDAAAIYGSVKPPVMGWCIGQLLDRAGLEASRGAIAELYEPVARVTDWWFRERDYDGDGMCQYMSGADSGWDNATCFDGNTPLEGADLAAHLVLQLEALGRMAEVLGKTGEARSWRQQSREQLQRLLTQGTRDGRFFSRRDGTDACPHSTSLLTRVPIVLGHRLPEPFLGQLIRDLAPGGPFLTEYGLATESPQSAGYVDDGYWRGPIWAPATHLIFHGLADAGETGLARMLASRFCVLCREHPGMWENYSALTGKGLRCPAYSWTAATFIRLANWLLEADAEDRARQ